MTAAEYIASKVKGATVSPITMLAEGTESCTDATYLNPAMANPCKRPHTTRLTCMQGGKHKHTSACRIRVHADEPMPGLLITSPDGKFRARVLASAQDSDLMGRTGPKTPSYAAYKHKAADMTDAKLAELAALPGVVSAEAVAEELEVVDMTWLAVAS